MNEEMKEEEYEHCSICLDDINKQTESKLNSCKHIFHFDCILMWSKKSFKCPLCTLQFKEIIYQNNTINVKREKQQNNINNNEDEDEDEDDDDFDEDFVDDDDEDYDDEEYEEVCDICQLNCDNSQVFYCLGTCGKCIHVECRVIQEPWYCNECFNRRRRLTNEQRLSNNNQNSNRNRQTTNTTNRIGESNFQPTERLQRIMKNVSESYIIPTVPQNTNHAIRLRSKSKLAQEIENDLRNEALSNESTDRIPKRPRQYDINQSRITNLSSSSNSNSSSSSTLFSNPNSNSNSNSSPYLTTPSTTTISTTFRPKTTQNDSISSILNRFMPSTSSSSSSSLSSSTSASPLLNSSLSSNSLYKSTTQQTYSLSTGKNISNVTNYSITSPTDDFRTQTIHPTPSTTPTSTTTTSSSSTTTPPFSQIPTNDLVIQYLTKLRQPLHLLQNKQEKMSEMIPKISNLCTQPDKVYLQGLLENGLLDILALYLTSRNVTTSIDSNSSINNKILTLEMQELILRTISCLPIKPKHLFTEKIVQKGNENIKIGKLITLVKILSDYIEKSLPILQKKQKYLNQTNTNQDSSVDLSTWKEEKLLISLGRISERILKKWSEDLKPHHPHAKEKIELIFTKVQQSTKFDKLQET